jgi:hypothetical protein
MEMLKLSAKVGEVLDDGPRFPERKRRRAGAATTVSKKRQQK